MKPLPLALGVLVRLGRFRLADASSQLSSVHQPSVYGDFVVITENGDFHGYDSCGNNLWRNKLGRTLINATEIGDDGLLRGPRMVPAIDGSLYVVFPPDLTSTTPRIAHVNATIMSVVAESPFSTPAFPNTYLTGSKLQTIESVVFDDSFRGWMNPTAGRHLLGRKLIFSINDWTLTSIDVTSQNQLWTLSFSELPPLTHSHLIPGTPEHNQVTRLGREIEISTSADSNRVIVKSRPNTCPDHSRLELSGFESQVLGVYALLSPGDTKGNLALVLVSKNSPIPTNFGGVPEGLFFNQLASHSIHSLPGVRVDYTQPSEGEMIDQTSTGSFPLVVRPRTYEIMTIVRDYRVDHHEVLSQYKVVDFLGFKFSQLSTLMKVYVILVSILAIYLSRKVYHWLLVRFGKTPVRKEGSPSMTILLPDGTALRQTITGEGTVSISSPTSTTSGARLVLIPSEATQPYEVVKVGQSDSVEFGKWQKDVDIEAFDKKIKDISQRTAKLPFAHSAASRRPSLEAGNATVLFLGRNVDEPKLVFRNPRAESELQRPNIPIYTQSIRNAVASSCLRESSSLRAYVPRAVCGYWNTFEGVFQEYVPKPKSANQSVSVQSFREYPESAVDTALLVMLLRDTDAHDGNYTRDLRRKIALFDLGCALADRPLPNDPIDRLALDNFEIWKRLPYLLNVPFDQRHVEYLESIDFSALKTMWQHYEYQEQLVEAARLLNSRLVHPTVMLRIVEMHVKFLLACARHGRSILFAAEVLYSGMYDDIWIEVGELNIDILEGRLVELASSEKSENEIFPHIDKLAQPPVADEDGPDGAM